MDFHVNGLRSTEVLGCRRGGVFLNHPDSILGRYAQWVQDKLVLLPTDKLVRGEGKRKRQRGGKWRRWLGKAEHHQREQRGWK